MATDPDCVSRPDGGAFQFGKIIRKRWQDHNIEKGIEQVMGYLTSLAAWAGGELAEEGIDLSVVLHWLAMKGDDYLELVKCNFCVEVQRKWLKFGRTTSLSLIQSILAKQA